MKNNLEKETLLQQLRRFRPFNEQEKRDCQLIIKLIEENNEVFSRESVLMHITSSAWITNDDFTKILLAYHKIYQSFSWLGGHNDGEIDCRQVAISEVTEESGLHNLHLMSEEIFAIDILPVPPHTKNGFYIGDHLHLNLCYLMVAQPAERLVINEAENEKLQWFDINDYESYINEERMITVYRKLSKKMKEKLWQY